MGSGTRLVSGARPFSEAAEVLTCDLVIGAYYSAKCLLRRSTFGYEGWNLRYVARLVIGHFFKFAVAAVTRGST